MSKKKSATDPVYSRVQEVQRYFHKTNTQMAEALGISPEAYRQQLRTKKAPQLYSLVRLDQENGISIEWILFNRGPMLLKTRDEEIEKLKKPFVDLFHEDVENMEQEMRKYPDLRHSIMQIYHNHLMAKKESSK